LNREARARVYHNKKNSARERFVSFVAGVSLPSPKRQSRRAHRADGLEHTALLFINMPQLSIKSFWRPKDAPGAGKPDAQAEDDHQHHQHLDDTDARKEEEVDEEQAPPSTKRMRLASAAPAPRRTSPRTTKDKDAAAAAPSPPAAAVARGRRGGGCEPAAATAVVQKNKSNNSNKDQKKQRQQQKRTATATEEEDDDSDDEDDEDEDDDDDDQPTPDTTTPAAAAPVGAADGLTDYERIRQEQIARNRARLAALELPAMAETLASTLAASDKARKQAASAGPTQRGATAAKRRAREEAAKAAKSPPAPRRQSSRVRGLAAEAVGPLPEDRHINIYGFVERPAEARFAPAPVPLAAASNTGGGAADAAFLRDLAARLSSSPGSSSSPHHSPASLPGASDLARLRLADEESVAKVTPGGITAAALHPGELAQGRLLLAAADKKGVVALWDVDGHRRSRAGAGAGVGAVTATEVMDDQAEEQEGGEGRTVRRGSGSGSGSGGGSGSGEGEDGGGGRRRSTQQHDGDDGVFQYDAHSQYVSGLRWVGHGASAKLLSASFDGSVRLLDLSRAAGPAAALAAGGGGSGGAADASSAPGFELLPGIPEEAQGLEWSAVEAADPGRNGAPLGPLVFLATNEGEMTAVDPRAPESGGRCLPLVTAHDKRVHSLSLEPGTGTLLASICTDGALKVWDVRKVVAGGGGGGGGAAAAVEQASAKEQSRWLPREPLGEGHHARSSHGAFWAPDGSQRLLSISFDDTLAVWQYGGAGGAASAAPPVVAGARVISKKGKKQAPDGDNGSGLLRRTLTLRHNNDTGRYCVPAKGFWGPAADSFFVAELDSDPYHGVGLYDAATGQRLGRLGGQGLLTAIPSRGCAGVLPGGAGVVVACTSSGRAHVFR
jgi:WD repeat-containing protein 76